MNNTQLSPAQANNLPGGWIGYAQITSNSASFTDTATDIAGLSQTVTVNPNRRIKITVDVSVDLDANDAVDFYIREHPSNVVLRGVRTAWGAISGANFIHFYAIITPTTGSHTYKFSAERANPGGTAWIVAGGNTGPSSLLIEDLGPAS